MSPRYLIDTNVLLYLHEEREPVKRARARDVLRRLRQAGTAALPAQALAEFANVALKKLSAILTPADIEARVSFYERTFPIIPLTTAIVLEAVRGVRLHQLAYYDAQLWAAAKLSQIPILLSEDFNAGSRIEGVTFLNPFAPSFDVKTL